MKKIAFVTPCVILVALLSSTVLGGTLVTPPETLRGLDGVGVVVPKFDARAIPGLTPTKVKADVELRLRRAGIRVLTREERISTRSGFLHVDVYPVCGREVCACNIDVSLYQIVDLERDKAISGVAPTWFVTTLGLFFPPTNVTKKVRNITKGLVDDFAKLYLTANPKK